MKKQIITKIIVIAVATLFMTACENGSSEDRNMNDTEHSDHSMFQCPMKCEGDKMYDKAGTCPVCDMDLEAVEHHH